MSIGVYPADDLNSTAMTTAKIDGIEWAVQKTTNLHSLIPKENDGLGRSFRFKETKASTRRGDDQQEKQEQRG
eukprot:CAMPEP_0172171616 /NCGR_PEP_ID=MMETSP1050-20130122/11990_1 /TAXON_ID=233186 /ORGANISM="Cryptomonas curvata, Strain CCAP979/52" /LENGTH=72 /DNA_ID=CAMNT_0012843065 /DNA_START=924 /DNA_END=1142 /DNA_ORIENTATION=-